MAASSGEEEDEFEYEEVEVEEEVEDDDDDDGEIEELVEEEEEEKEPLEEEEQEEEEEEEEEPMEEEEEEPMEDEEEPMEEEEEPMEDEEEPEEEEEEYEEVEEVVEEKRGEEIKEEEEEEEYEEIEEEVEVTDDEEDEEMEVAAAAAVAVAVSVKNESAVESSDSPLPVTDHPLHDACQDKQAKANEVCSRSTIQDTVNTDVAAAPLDIPAVGANGSTLESSSRGQQNIKRKEPVRDTVFSEVAAAPLDISAVEANGSTLGSSSRGQQNNKRKVALQDTVTSEVAAPPVIQAVEASMPTLGSPTPCQKNKKGKEVLSVNDGSSNPPARVKMSAEIRTKLKADKAEFQQGRVQRSPLVTPVKETFSIDDGSSNTPTRLKSDDNPPKLKADAAEGQQGRVQRSPLVSPVKEKRSIDDGSTNLPARLKSEANPPKLRGDTMELKHGLVEKSPLIAPVKAEKSHVKHIAPVGTSEKYAPGEDNIHDMDQKALRSEILIETPDMVETTVPSQKEDLHLPSSENMDQNALRYYTPQIRLRSSSPKAESEAVSKRSAIVCEYFAKGWCIKGSNCRFLHKRDQVDYTKGQVEGFLESTDTVIGPGKGVKDAAGASASFAHKQPKSFMAESDDMLPVSTGGKYTDKDHRESVNDKDNFRMLERDTLYPRLSVSSQRSPHSKEGSKIFSGQNEAEVDMFKGSCSSDRLERHGSSASLGRSTLLDNLTPRQGFLSEGAGVTSGTQMNHSSLSYVVVEESVALRRQYTLELHSSPISGFSSKSSGSFRNAPLLDNSSVKELLESYKNNKQKFTPYNWEPSVPFRPSHFIPSFTRSSSDVQYDPLRDSIDQPYAGRGSLRNSSYGQTKGPKHQHAQSISGRKSVESNKMLHSDSNYKDYYNHDKDARLVEAESAAISATNAENKNTSDEEILGVAASVKDVLKANRSISDGNSQLKVDDLRHKGQTNEFDEEESRVIKIFRAALIEFVKELMKPVWHEGRLSKDVYKVIVQKAEDKILSTLPSTEVPNTPESIKQYLSSSRPNILKLIQAYVDKYGKF